MIFPILRSHLGPVYSARVVIVLFVLLSVLNVTTANPSDSGVIRFHDSTDRLVGDLKKKEQEISLELAKILQGNTLPKSMDPENLEIIKQLVDARSAISDCLITRTMLARRGVIPSDPGYKARQECSFAELDLKTAETWWKYCRETSGIDLPNAFDEWPLAISLINSLKKVSAKAEKFPLAPKPNPVESAKSGDLIDMRYGIGAIPGHVGKPQQSLLDKANFWNQMSEAEKKESIHR